MRLVRSFGRRADSDDLQLNFGVIAKAEMGDSVKVTVIATGFAKPEEVREPLIESVPVSEFFAERPGGVGSVAEAPAEPVIVASQPPPPVYEDDLDVPAYLRQGKLLN